MSRRHRTDHVGRHLTRVICGTMIDRHRRTEQADQIRAMMTRRSARRGSDLKEHEMQWHRSGRWHGVLLRNPTLRRSMRRPLAEGEDSLPRFLMLAGALIFLASTVLVVTPLSVLSQPHLSTALDDRLLDRSRPLVVIAQATPMATPVAVSCPNGDNLLTNADFESGEEGWYVEEDVEPTTTETHSGNTALRLGPSGAGYIDQWIASITPDTTYKLSGWGKVSTDGETGEIGLVLRDGNGVRLDAEEPPPPLTFTTTAFVEQSLTFTVSAPVAQVVVYAVKGDGAAQFYVDTLVLSSCQAPEALEATPAATPAVAMPTIAVSGDQSATPPANSRQGCDPAYPEERTCIPPGPPLAAPCAITDERNFTVLPPDPRRLDRDGDGIGCEPISPQAYHP
jgi:hypothetical protein